MQIENEFEVAAPPERVFEFLLDVNRVVTCMPGAELSEVVDPDTFKGRVKIKVGPITVAYNGTARIAERDEAARRAVLQADGRETTGPGSAGSPGPAPEQASRPYEPSPRPTTGPPPAPAQAAPVNALSLFFAVLWDRVKRLFGRG